GGAAGPTDTRVLVGSKEGKFLMQVGKAVSPPTAGAATGTDTGYAGVSGAARGGGRGGRGRGRGAGPPPLPPNNTSTEAFGGATGFAFDASANEAYVSDGSRNRRIAVVDMNTGAIKRVFGAYGNMAEDANPGPYNPDGA